MRGDRALRRYAKVKVPAAALAGAVLTLILSGSLRPPSFGRVEQAPVTVSTAVAQSSDAASTPQLQIVDHDTWLTTNAKHDGNAWLSADPSRPSFALWMNERGAIPFEGTLAGAGLWVHRAGCAQTFAIFAQQCGWNLGLVATEDKSVIVGGNAIEIDGNGSLPYGRLVNTSAGPNHYVGLASNVFGDFSGVDQAGRPSWLAAVNISSDSFEVLRRDVSGNSTSNGGSKRAFEPLLAVKRTGDVEVAGSISSAVAEQRAPGQWATRVNLKAGRSTFVFPHAFEATPVCVASSEDPQSGTVRVHPTRSSCTVVADRLVSSAVDIVVIGNPR